MILLGRSFEHIKLIDYEVADYREYHLKRAKRDQGARAVELTIMSSN